MDKQQGPTVEYRELLQFPVINHNGKENEKEYIYITEPFYCTAEINTTL